MLKNFVSVVLLFFIIAQSPLVAALSVHDAHHDENTSVHEYFHSIGQPHEHDQLDAEKFEISDSQEALEHNNALNDAGGVGIMIFAPTNIAHPQPEASIDEVTAWWASPIIKYATPPPKI